MTVGQIISEGVTAHGLYKPRSQALHAYVLEVMKKCGLDEYALHRYPHEFSGGQRQRVCIARALAVKPRFVVCDECVSALDVSIQAQIINLLSHLKEKENLTYLFISHDLSVVRHIADTIAVMYLGKIVEIGKGESVFKNPLHPYTMALIRSVPTLTQNKKQRRIYLPSGVHTQENESVGCPFAKRCFMAEEICFSKPVELWEGERGHFASCHFLGMPKKQKESKIDGERV
jgi:peptide/nickel transport system ATP-binding protein